MTRTIIPKDCIVCDLCNKAVSDEKFIAIEFAWWYEGWLYCDECNKHSDVGKELPLIMEIQKGNDLSQTDLALPIVIEDFE